jgi:hypothetical protein
MPFLKEHIYSNFSNRLYGAAGSQVAIIADHSTVQIVEDSAGNRFPVNTDLLDGVAPTDLPEFRKIEQVIPGRSKRKKAVVTQSNIF